MAWQMKLGICLQTCGRENYTQSTLQSWSALNPYAAQNDLGAKLPLTVELFHCADGTPTRGNLELAFHHGFRNISEDTEHVGVHERRRRIVHRLADMGMTHVLILENDWESNRSMPWQAIYEAMLLPQVLCFRLYGKYKERGAKRPTGIVHALTGYTPKWHKVPDMEPACEIANIHWGAPPCVMEIDLLKHILDNSKDDHHAMRVSGDTPYLTMRVVNNIFYHIGDRRTLGFKP